MRTILLIFLLAFGIAVKAQQKVDTDISVSYNTTNNESALYVTNKKAYPITIKLAFSLQNAKWSQGEKIIFEIPENTIAKKVGSVKQINRSKAWQFNYKYIWGTGYLYSTKPNESYIYDLPFKKGTAHSIIQGYNGSFSHQNQYSLDFDLLEGTQILAAREGKVVDLKEQFEGNCPTKACADFGNYITIMHNDNTFATYYHIQKNGVMVNIGDFVKKGDLIALSGNTGWSIGPHLHFICYINYWNGAYNSIPTKFKINKGAEYDILQENKTYKKDY